ncbi:MAG: hypothetical protein R3200_04265 [Xanthomonadales bacterium]|nr:hypothetical protein [Xanthomonadales bacterium]
MKPSFYHNHDPMGWSFETLRDPTAWLRPITRTRVGRPTIGPGIRGVIGGTGALLATLLVVQAAPDLHQPNITAAWLAAGGLILMAAAFEARQARGTAGLIATGFAVMMLAFLGESSGSWLAGSALAAGLGGLLGARMTRFAGLLTGWAWFHGLLAATLMI